MEKQKIIFSIPELGERFSITKYIILYFLKNRYKFYDDVEIGSVYGSYPCIWNGGRVLDPYEMDNSVIEKDISFLNSHNIAARYTFTNLSLTEDDLKDNFGNFILDETVKYQTIKNDVNTATEIMKNYVETKYPQLNTVCSTTMCLNTIEKINKSSENHLVVPDYKMNNQFNKLKELQHPENIEILVNEICKESCPYRAIHYKNNSDYIVKREKELWRCRFFAIPNYHKVVCKRDHHVTLKDIREKYLPLGINKFKLIGRTTISLILIEGIIEYMVKPEFQGEVRDDLLLACYEPTFAERLDDEVNNEIIRLKRWR